MRRRWMKRRRRRRATTPEALAYMGWVKTLPCCCPGPCVEPFRPTEGHHAGKRGMSQKASDYTVIPLSDLCHDAFDDATGPFKGMVKAARRAWADAQIEKTQRHFWHLIPPDIRATIPAAAEAA